MNYKPVLIVSAGILRSFIVKVISLDDLNLRYCSGIIYDLLTVVS